MYVLFIYCFFFRSVFAMCRYVDMIKNQFQLYAVKTINEYVFISISISILLFLWFFFAIFFLASSCFAYCVCSFTICITSCCCIFIAYRAHLSHSIPF